MVDNFTDMIAGSLNLSDPWYAEGAKFSLEKKEVHIYVNVREGQSLSAPAKARVPGLAKTAWSGGFCAYADPDMI